METRIINLSVDRFLYSFSPLAGISYVETASFLMFQLLEKCFSPLAGISYVETYRAVSALSSSINGFSPLAGISYVETTLHADCVTLVEGVFQSPCGD